MKNLSLLLSLLTLLSTNAVLAQDKVNHLRAALTRAVKLQSNLNQEKKTELFRTLLVHTRDFRGDTSNEQAVYRFLFAKSNILNQIILNFGGKQVGLVPGNSDMEEN